MNTGMKCFPLGDGRSTTIGCGPPGQVHFRISLGTARGSFTNAERHSTLKGCDSVREKLMIDMNPEVVGLTGDLCTSR
jgi:hypothetical protein